ncbi:MAG: dihydroxyacetone kinase subunit L [Chloroflexi bacterium]|nr:dihydroxyacetone kinase subunit L [Chloroflexota bacterium]
MDSFPAANGSQIIRRLVATIQDNAAYLSELDGAIGDGDHGINMSKGFGLALAQLDEQADLSTGLATLGETLFTEIGGAMGPLYGTFFSEMAAACQNRKTIDAILFGTMLQAGLHGVQDLGDAKVCDKTLVDTLAPATKSYVAALTAGATFAEALQRMARAAESGKESTRDLVAQIGRASRLGERTRGHLDAGATSCYLILDAMAGSMLALLAK